jgi:hypothetical protein
MSQGQVQSGTLEGLVQRVVVSKYDKDNPLRNKNKDNIATKYACHKSF